MKYFWLITLFVLPFVINLLNNGKNPQIMIKVIMILKIAIFNVAEIHCIFNISVLINYYHDKSLNTISYLK